MPQFHTALFSHIYQFLKLMSFDKKQISWRLCLNDQVIYYVFSSQSVVINRLAAVHRGTLRALQVVTHQLSDLSHGKVPLHLKELGQLIRQLSLCSAKVEVEQGSAVPETALHILQKLEVRCTEVIKYLDGVSCCTSYPHLPPHFSCRSLHSHTVYIVIAPKYPETTYAVFELFLSDLFSVFQC